MPNPLRGEVPLTGTEYILRFSVNTICAIEAETDASFVHLIAVLDAAGDKVKVSDLRRWVRWGLAHAHPGMTDEQAGDIADQAGGLKIVFDAVGAALRAALGTTEGKADTSKKASSRQIG